MLAQFCEYTKKNIKLHTVVNLIIWELHVSIKMFKKMNVRISKWVFKRKLVKKKKMLIEGQARN